METEKSLNNEILDQTAENIHTESTIFDEKNAYEKALRCAFMEKKLTHRRGKLDVLDASVDGSLSNTSTCLWVYSGLVLGPLAYIIYTLIAQVFGTTLWVDIMFIVCLVFAIGMLIFYIYNYISEKREKKYIASMRQEVDILESQLRLEINADPLVKEIYNKFNED
ncbi:MAG: hypothetical protein IJA82_01310 [Clostridia bacterium]|nr:hypothetical protein [Clostridia bacterium]